METTAPKKPASKNKIYLIIGGVVAVAAAIYFWINRKKNPSGTANNATTANSGVSDKGDTGTGGTGTGGTGTSTSVTTINIAPFTIMEANKDPNSYFYNKYSLSTTISLLNPPKSGTLTVSIDNIVTGTFPLPLKGLTDIAENSVIYLTFEKADGLEHTMTAAISGTKATKSVKFTAPTGV